MTLAEQKALFDGLEGSSPATKLVNLRILLGAIRISKAEHSNLEFEKRIYSTSIKESIIQKQFETLPHMLRHLTNISLHLKWNELLAIPFSNTRQFYQAILRSQKPSDLMHV